MTDLQIFNSPEFGAIRTIEKDGEPWFVGKDVANALGYKDTVNALKSHVDTEDKGGWQITTHIQLAAMIGREKNYVYAICNGKVSPRIDQAYIICRALDIPPEAMTFYFPEGSEQ